MTPASRVLLVGMMGTGKTTVGQAISARTGWPAFDNDVLLQRATGRTAAELLAEQGEPALRRAESQVLTLLLGLPVPLVAGVPGGVVLDPADRDRLRAGGHVVWLRAPAEVLARRIGSASGRPWLGSEPLPALRALAAERDPLYAEVATQVVDVDVSDPGEIAEDVLTALRG